MDLLTLQYHANPEFTKQLDFKLLDYNGHKAINGTFTFRNDVEPSGNLLITIPRPKTKPWKLLNVTINFCEFIKNSKSLKMGLHNIVMNAITKSIANFPNKCPFVKVSHCLNFLNQHFINNIISG